MCMVWYGKDKRLPGLSLGAIVKLGMRQCARLILARYNQRLSGPFLVSRAGEEDSTSRGIRRQSGTQLQTVLLNTDSGAVDMAVVIR